MVEFLTAWNGTATGKRVELGAVEEARLIAAGIARAYTTGQEKGPGIDLTDAEEAAVARLTCTRLKSARSAKSIPCRWKP